jgi:hypothetical protein
MLKFPVIVVSVLILLSGCVERDNVSTVSPEQQPVKNNVMVNVETVMNVSGEPDFSRGDHVVKSEGNTVTVMLGGSGSCPPMVNGAVYDSEENLLSFVLYEYGEVACTMDYGQYFYEVTLANNIMNSETRFEFCYSGNCYPADS